MATGLTTIKIENGTARMPEWRLAQPVNLEINENEHIAIIGNNAGGKSLLVGMLTGSHPLIDEPKYCFGKNRSELISENIKYISFEDAYGTANSNYYLQQRWNMHDIDDETPTAGDFLNKELSIVNSKAESLYPLRDKLYDLFSIRQMLDKYIISLSSGELRKLHIVKSLLSSPKILILDNPNIGLDKSTRNMLNTTLESLAAELNIQIILVQPSANGLPKFITHIVEVNDLIVSPKKEIKKFLNDNNRESTPVRKYEEKYKEVTGIPYTISDTASSPHDNVVEMHNVNITYGKRHIINDFNWTVANGDCWAINGENGAGKSTLLSLICADNPQCYACDISLFGRKRGSGESIWEIKKRIGYVSPEMHRAYKKNITALRIMASGMKDSVGLYTHATDDEISTCLRWMDIFGISKLKERNFLTLSSGEQRLVLLARAFVKDPQLLILDEPFHGLDENNKEMARNIIDAFARRKDKTIIMVSHYEEEYPSCINKVLTLKKCFS